MTAFPALETIKDYPLGKKSSFRVGGNADLAVAGRIVCRPIQIAKGSTAAQMFFPMESTVIFYHIPAVRYDTIFATRKFCSIHEHDHARR